MLRCSAFDLDKYAPEGLRTHCKLCAANHRSNRKKTPVSNDIGEINKMIERGAFMLRDSMNRTTKEEIDTLLDSFETRPELDAIVAGYHLSVLTTILAEVQENDA
jgi:hypothetical protein